MKKSIASEVKVRAVLEVLKGEKSALEIAGGIGCHPTILKEWKERFLVAAPKTKKVEDEKVRRIETLERLIGKLTVQNEFLKKVHESFDSR